MRLGTLFQFGQPARTLPLSVQLTGNFVERMRGLLARPPLVFGEALLIRPCSSVHTIGMAYALDLVYLDRAGRVIRLVEHLVPGRFDIAFGAAAVLELPAGSLARLGIAVGQRYEWCERPVQRTGAAERPRVARQRGQAAAEFVVILPVLIMLLLGAIQFGLLYQARSLLDHATFLAARAGAMNHGDKGAMQTAFANAMLPLFAHSTDITELATALPRAVLETRVFASLNTVNPTAAAMKDFGTARLDGSSGKEIPNDTLMYRKPTAGGSSGMSVQDANLLRLRTSYCVRLIVPAVNRLIWGVANGIGTGTQGDGMRGILDSTQADVNGTVFGLGKDCAGTLPGVTWQPRIRISSEAIVRMQSSFYDSNL
jgi:uncharacterized membrane protein (UPF0127 family)/Flp pilus assembly protein TadG